MIGKYTQRNSPRNDATLVTISMLTKEAKISDLWRLDVLGINDPIQIKEKEVLLKQVKEHFRQTVTFNENKRYEVLLPWRENYPPPLVDNRDMAAKRLETTTKRLKGEGLYTDYCQVLQEWEREGIIEKVPLAEERDHGYYLPHRHVLKEDSTTRLRPVFDASAGGKDAPLLNQCLEVGPNLIELIPKSLLRFREKKIGITADIKKAFLQIAVSPLEGNALLFLWWEDDNCKKMMTYSHCRVVFGVTSSPFLLGATIELHLEKMLEDATSNAQKTMISKLAESFYVDNCVTSVDTWEELQLFREIAIDIMSMGGFLLRGWEYTMQNWKMIGSLYLVLLGTKA